MSPHSSINPRVATDAAGDLSVLWNGEDNLHRLAVSQEAGASWRTLMVPPPGVRATLFGVLAAGQAGRAVVAYLGTDADPARWQERDPSFAGDEAAWHLYLTFLEDALAPEPPLVTLRATPPGDPLQRGCIGLHGGANPCRDLYA